MTPLMNITVKFDALPFRKALIAAYKNQIPFAAAHALTTTAKQAQARIQREMPDLFTIRNRHIQRGIRIMPAKKNNLRAEVGSIDTFMRLQVTGGIKRGEVKGEGRAIPGKAVRPTFAAKVPRSKFPGALQAKGGRRKPFKVRFKSGREALVRRVGSHRLPIEALWYFPSQVQVDARLDLGDLVEGVARTHWPKNMVASFEKALKTAR